MNRTIISILMLVPQAGLAASETELNRLKAGDVSAITEFVEIPMPSLKNTADVTGINGIEKAAPNPANRYAVYKPAGKASVTVDSRTGLMWVTDPVDAGIDGSYTWENAVNACRGLNYAGFGTASTTDADPYGWRLPNKNELMSIVDDRVAAPPLINKAYFFNTQNNAYWTSTTFETYAPNAWIVLFQMRYECAQAKTSRFFVRCVRWAR